MYPVLRRPLTSGGCQTGERLLALLFARMAGSISSFKNNTAALTSFRWLKKICFRNSVWQIGWEARILRHLALTFHDVFEELSAGLQLDARSVSAPTHISLWHLQYMQTNILVLRFAIFPVIEVRSLHWKTIMEGRISWTLSSPYNAERADSESILIPIDGIWICISIFFFIA